ncbi:hypothetical protein SLEP1_g2235 [Rubroshorea leprosula]|uniref:Uncharacterized protein n=1 Tax=Rubroshorea leprosula TaxID=152421 RepID=A0AAV5HGH9_9ROSI|nr:hypothetical protein SLEP1_g2235 [Rubroshorea leprosula]
MSPSVNVREGNGYFYIYHLLRFEGCAIIGRSGEAQEARLSHSNVAILLLLHLSMEEFLVAVFHTNQARCFLHLGYFNASFFLLWKSYLAIYGSI